MSRVKASVQTERSSAATDSTSPGSAPALDRALDILELLSSTPTGLTLSELSVHLSHHADSTCARLSNP